MDNTFGDFTKCGKNTNGSVIGKITLVIGLKNRSDVRQFPDYGGILSPDKFPQLMIMMKNYKMNTLKIFFGILLPFLTQISEL